MKLAIPTIGVLASVIVLASIGIFYAYHYEMAIAPAEYSFPAGSALFTTNVHVTKFNEHGQVTALRQGTNHITETGMSIIMGQVFGGFDEDGATDLGNHGINGSYFRTNPADAALNVTGRVAWMEIGTSGDDVWPVKLKYNNTDVITEVGSPCIKVRIDVSNFTQGNAHPAPSHCANLANDFVDSGAGGASAITCSARMNVTATAQFQGVDCQALSIDEAGIFTASHAECIPGGGGTCGLMFARNIFGSVNLGALDTLQLEWEFTFTDS